MPDGGAKPLPSVEILELDGPGSLYTAVLPMRLRARTVALAVGQIPSMVDLAAIGFGILHHAGQESAFVGEFR